MNKFFVALLLIVFPLSACSFDVQIVTPIPVPSESLASTEPATVPVATISATADKSSATPPQGQSIPRFFNARFADSPDNESFRSSYSIGIKEIFAIWDYENMEDGLIVRREWYLDGRLWLQREEPWDFSKYGEKGTVRDVSIYDLDVGLPAGAYQLRLFIEGVQQPIGASSKIPVETWANFSILPDEFYAGFLSPNSQWSAQILSGGRLIVRDINGSPTELFVGLEIPYLVWLPDSRHILFVDRDRSGKQPDTPMGVRDDLWIVDIMNTETHLLYRSNSAFSGSAGPVPSADGHYVAAIDGSGFGDACIVDSRLIFFRLARDFLSLTILRQEEFAGIPSAPDSTVYPVEEGAWQNNTQYLANLNGTCNIEQNRMGSYLFDVSNLTAQKQ